uniref:Putative secreted protein n=1 Tax=Ixodes scapularis TaxID=6945 RepID=A0A4D5RCX8_IXOSC
MYILIFYFASSLLKGTKATSQIKSAQICGYEISIADMELLGGTLCTSRAGSLENKPRACPSLGCERHCRNRRTLRCAELEGSSYV